LGVLFNQEIKMKKQIFLLIAVVVLIVSCTSTTASSISSFSSITGKEWKLIEVQIDNISFNRIALYDRNDLKKNNVGNIYTMVFDAEMVSGTGAPNKYSAPYTLEEDDSLKILVIRSTLMAPIVQPEKLQEHDFYLYMQNVEKWSTDNNKLILHSKTESGSSVRLIFIP
jgi:heat shock protein HslJ